MSDPTSITGSLTATGNLFSQDMLGYESISVQVTSAGTACTVTYESSNDNSTWVSVSWTNSASGEAPASTSTTAGLRVFPHRGRYFRARVSTYGSGTVTVAGELVKESDNFTPATAAAAGPTEVEGTTADGAAFSDNPVVIAGVDGSGNTQTMAVSTSGNPQVTGSIASGSADSGNPIKIGGVNSGTLPIFSSGQRGDLQIGTRGGLHVNLMSNNSTTAIASATVTVDTTAVQNALYSNNFNLVYDAVANQWPRRRGDSTAAYASAAPQAGTDRSITATTTSQQLMASNTQRHGVLIRNDTAIDVWINFGATAIATAGGGNYKIPAGGTYESGSFTPSSAINIIAASGTPAISAREF